jgi:hypothetical protein
MTNTSNATPTADAIIVPVEWADSLPSTDSVAVLTEAIEKDLNELIAEKIYPAGTRLVRRISGGLEGDDHYVFVELSFPDVNAAYEFFVAYCGGDKEHARDELHLAGYSL